MWYFLFFFALQNPSVNTHESTCPKLTPLPDLTIQEAYENQPYYVVLVPSTPAYESVDNICFTTLPVPDNENIYQSIVTTVYCDGSVSYDVRLVTMDIPGIFITASPGCTYSDTVFKIVDDVVCGCEIYLLYLCVLQGECPSQLPMPVFGLATNPTTITDECLVKVQETLSLLDIAPVDLTPLPVTRDSQCVRSQPSCTSSAYAFLANPFNNRYPFNRQSLQGSYCAGYLTSVQ